VVFALGDHPDALPGLHRRPFGFLYAGVVVTNTLAGNPAQGWSSLMVVVLVVGGIQMLMMGVLGEYLWRALDESRRRPHYLSSTFALLTSYLNEGVGTCDLLW
jgi:hypothetical protein